MEKRRKKAAKLEKKLLAYSATAGAAILSAPASQGAIHLITNANFMFDGHAVTTLNPAKATFGTLPAGTGINFVAGGLHGEIFNSYFGGPSVQIEAYGGFMSRIYNPGTPLAGHVLVPGGTLINKTNFVTSRLGGQPIAQFFTGAWNANLFYPSKPSGYLAFQFMNAGKHYYGWMKAQFGFVGDDATTFEFIKNTANTVFGAYGLAGDGLTVGEAAPEPSPMALSGLALLAFGAMGVREMRRRRAQEAAVA